MCGEKLYPLYYREKNNPNFKTLHWKFFKTLHWKYCKNEDRMVRILQE